VGENAPHGSGLGDEGDDAHVGATVGQTSVGTGMDLTLLVPGDHGPAK
jgi:hypothetical protein